MRWPKRRWWLSRWINDWRMTLAVRRHPSFAPQVNDYRTLIDDLSLTDEEGV